MRLARSCTVLALLGLVVPPLHAQQTGYSESTPRVDFGGVLFAHFQYRIDENARHQNRFDLERAQLTSRATLTDKLTARLTIDVFQQSDPNQAGFYRGWVMRAKYAYLQYDFLDSESPDAFTAQARLGITQTVMIEHHETFWPRWMGVVAEERFGYFQSADMGASAVLSFPRKMGEIYAAIMNGPGYTGREQDRFKDYGVRLTLTPLASLENPVVKTATLTAWGYKGALASRFVSGGPGQIGAVGSGIRRDRWGILAGVRDPRLTAVAAYSNRIDETELGDNTPVSPRVLDETTGKLFSTSLLVKPLALIEGNQTPLRLVARYDRFRPADDVSGRTRFVVVGAIWDLARTVSLSADYQEQTSSGGATLPTTKTWFLHLFVGY